MVLYFSRLKKRKDVVSADVHVVDGTDLFFYFVMSCLVFFLFLIHATAVGKCFAEKLNKLDYAISSYKRAYRHQDHEGIAAFQLGELYHQKYKKNKKDGETRHLAATYYSKHVEMHDEEGIRGGDGYVSSLKFLSRYHYQEKNYEVAEHQCRKLLDMGSHQESEEAKALLRDIRAATNGNVGGSTNDANPPPMIFNQ